MTTSQHAVTVKVGPHRAGLDAPDTITVRIYRAPDSPAVAQLRNETYRECIAAGLPHRDAASEASLAVARHLDRAAAR